MTSTGSVLTHCSFVKFPVVRNFVIQSPNSVLPDILLLCFQDKNLFSSLQAVHIFFYLFAAHCVVCDLRFDFSFHTSLSDRVLASAYTCICYFYSH